MNFYVYENFSLTEGSQKCKLACQMKELYQVSAIVSSIFFDKFIPALTPDTAFHERCLFLAGYRV